jgi:hypothetical protein
MTDRERVERYVRRYFELTMDWPTVRQVARALGLRQQVVVDEAVDVPLMVTAYYTDPPEKFGDHYVEICE